MPSSFSDLKIELIANGEQSGTWGTTTNTNLGTALEEAIAGRANAVFTSDADLTISLTDTNATQVARNYILNVTSSVSLTATRNLIVPTIDKPYVVENNTTGGQSILVKTSAGTGITVPNGKTAMVYANSTDVVSAVTYIPSVSIAGGSVDNSTIGATTRAAGNFTNLDANGNVVLCSDASDTLSINTNAVSTPNGLNFDSNTLVIDATNNRIGVNTASPSHALDIAGTCRVQGQFTIGDASIDSVICNASSVSTPNGLNFDSNTFVIDAATNRVGIGTASPTQALDVLGSARVTGSVSVDTNLTVTGTGTVTSTFTTEGTTNIASLGGNTTIGQSGPGTTLTLNSDSVAIPNNLSIDSNTLYIDASTNRVGIGTNIPAAELGVSGSVDITQSLAVGVSLTVPSIVSMGTLSVLPSGNFSVDSGTLFVNTSTNAVGINTSTPVSGSALNVNGLLLVNAGTASDPPLKLVAGTNTSGTNAGAIEYDGTRFYATADATSGRGYVPSAQIFRLSANGAAVGPGIANFFGVGSAANLAASGVYELEAYLYFTKTTAGTVTVTLTTSVAPTSLSGTVRYGALAGGVATGAANQINLFNSTATAAAFGASGSLATAVNHLFIVRALVEAAGSASNIRINVTSSAGTVTPLRTSYYKLTRLPSSNTGSFTV